MWDTEDIQAAITAEPKAAAEALERLRLNYPKLPDAAGYNQAADILNTERAQFWVERLDALGLLDDFGLALQAQGVVLSRVELPDAAQHFDDDKLQVFVSQARSARCRILADGNVVGSGILVGPSSVLTAWHVIAAARPQNPQQLKQPIQVQLSDGRVINTAAVPFHSFCGDAEWDDQRAPSSDAEVVDRHDLALLTVRRAAGLAMKYPRVPTPAYEPPPRGSMLLLHFPNGTDSGIANGFFYKMRGVTARWGHDAPTKFGSSGGGCFDSRFSLIGVHQGKHNGKRNRMVPAVRFPPQLIELIDRDQAPDALWSLDGSASGSLVLGRGDFFRGYGLAQRGSSRVRGLWVQRSDPAAESTGLQFTFEILRRLTQRSPHAEVARITLDALTDDLCEEIARRLSNAGFPVATPESVTGVAAGHAQFEAIIADRARRIAGQADELARERGVHLWIYFDQPSIAFPYAARLVLEAFIGAALNASNLRLILAGYEAFQIPGERFFDPAQAFDAERPGLYVEVLSGFRHSDIIDFLDLALTDLGVHLDNPARHSWVTDALHSLAAGQTVFAPADANAVLERLRPRLQSLETGGAI